MIQDNPARLVATPKLPKRLPAVLSAEEMNAFLDGLGVPASRAAQSVAGQAAAARNEARERFGSPLCCSSAIARCSNCFMPRACASAS